MTADHETFNMLEQLAPDLMKKVTLRAMVLERISVLQPVGRRALAQRLHMPEREIRSVCDALKEDGLIYVTSSGMTTTERADGLLPISRAMTGRRSTLGQLEQHLSRVLNTARVYVAPGSVDEDAHLPPASARQSASPALCALGRIAAEQLVRLLAPGMVLAVSGGRLMAAAAAAMPSASPINGKANLRVVPARGTSGTDVEIQPDTLAAKFAQALGGTHSLLHLPDAVPDETLRELMKLPQIAQTMQLLARTDVLIYSVECAETAARAQGLIEETIRRILDAGAVGEAAGCYFDAAGRIVHHPSAVGLSSSQLSKIHCIAAAAAGASQAKALLSVLRHHRHELVVLDESAARALEKLI